MPSNYNTRFFFRFETDAHREMRINIQQRGYSGAAVQRAMGATPVLKRDSGNNGIFGTSLEIVAECNSDNEYAVLYTTDPREFYVELIDVDRNVTLWDGYVSPELYSAPEVYPPYDVRIIAVDGLGELKRDNFVNSGRTSLLNHLISILSHSGLQTNASNILIIDSLSCQTPYVPSASLLSSIQVDLGNLTERELTCYEALEAILATLNLTITRYGSKWLLIRESDVEVEAGAVAAKTAAGETVVLPVIEYGSAADHDWWPVGRVEDEVVPARNRVSVSLAYARRTMFENADLVNGSGWIYPEESIENPSHYVKWMQIADGLRPELRNVIENGSVTIRQEISVAQFDGRLTLRVLTMQFGAFSKPKYKVFLRVAISDGSVIRFLQYHENGNYCEWVSSSTEIEYEEQVLSGYSSSAQIPISAFNAKEFAIPGIPITGTLGVFITAKRTSFLSDPCDFFLGGVYLSQDAVPGYKDTIVIDNGARGSAGDAVSVFGDAPYTPNGLKNVLNVTADGNGVITTDWQTSKFGGELLSVMAMDRALGVALPRLLSKGVLNVPGNAGLPAVIVNPDGVPMLIQRSSWKLLDDEVEVEILSVPAASVEITSESIVPISEDQAEAITGGTAGTSGGGGTPYTPVPDEKLFEAIYGNGGITGAKALYDIYIKQVEADEEHQIEEQLKNATEILKHLFLVPNDGRPYIRSDIGFVSEDFVSGAGLSTTQGGGGGGGSIATLSDVSLSGLANGNILVYDSQTQMWKNQALNLGTAASYNIGMVALNDNGLVTGGAVYDAINTVLSAAVKFVGITTTALTDGSTTSTVTIDGASHVAQRGDEVIYGGKEFLWTGSKWQQLGDEQSWALKTVTITGTGYLTGGGTLGANRTLDIGSTYKTYIQNGNTAYGWGNHANAGYASGSDLTAISNRVGVLEARTNWDDYLELDTNGDIHVKGNRGLWSDSFLSGAGLSSGSGGSSGFDIDAMWNSLTNSVTDPYANTPIAVAHIPNITTAKISDLEGWILGKGYATTSSLAGYLPLTGGTLTGPLSINSSLTVAQGVVVSGPFYGRAETFQIYVRDYVTTETPADRYILRFRNDTENNTTSLIIGGGTYGNTPTYLFGKNFRFTTYDGSAAVHAMYINSSGNVGIGVTSTSLKLDVAGDIRARNRLYIGTGGAYIEVDADGNLHTPNAFYSDSFVSGGGLSTTPGGGGGGGVDLTAMWNSLTNSVTDAYANTPIAVAHIPDITTSKITNLESWIAGKGYATSSALAGYLPLIGGILTGNLEISKRNTEIIFNEQRISSGGGGWAVDCLTFRDPSETVRAAIGWYGNAMTPNYMYMGFGVYNGATNFRIYQDGIRFGNNVIWHAGNDGAGSGLDADLLDGKDGSYYATAASLGNYVSGVTVYGDYLRVTKGAANTDLTIPFATTGRRFKRYSGTASEGGYDLNTLLEGGGLTANTNSYRYWNNAPTGAGIGAAIQFSTGINNGVMDMQLLWDINSNSETPTRRMWWRTRNQLGWAGDWHLIYDSTTLTLPVLMSIIGDTTYAPYDPDGYLPLRGGTLSGALTVNSSLTTTGTIIAGNNINFSKSSFNDITATASNGAFRFFTAGDTTDYAMYIASNKNVSFAGSTLISGYIYGRRDDFRLYVRDTVSAETASDKMAIRFHNNATTGISTFYIGSGTYVTSPTYIYGREIRFATHNGTTSTTVMTMTSAGNVGIGVTSTSLKLDVAGDIRARNRLYIGTGGAYIEVDSSGNLHTASGFYSDSFVSGSGLSTTQGGGGGGVDLATMWNSLTNSVSDAYANTPIAVAHIPDITTAKISNIEDWIASKNFITAASLPLAASGTRGGMQIGYTTDATNRNYAVQLSSEQAYVNVPWIEYNFTGVSFTSGDRYTGTHDANAIMSNGVWYYQSHGPAISIGASTNDGALYSQSYSTQWVVQIAQDYRNGRLFFRARNNSAWTTWLTNIDSGNYASILDPWVEAKGYALAASIPSALPNPYVLSFGSKTYDGSAATTLTAADLGALTSINVTNYDATLSRNASSMTLARVQGTAITVSVPNFALVSDIPIALPNPKALTFNTSQRSYDGSAAMTITAADFGALTTVQVVNYDSTLSRNASSMTLARVHGTAITVSVPNFALVSDIPTALPNPYALSFGSKTYDGSASRTITASDFGLGSAASNIDTLFGYFNGYGAANEAVQLTTTRTIWGQEFDGTQNVSGAISGATTGAFSSWVQASYYYVGSSATAYLEYRNNMLHANVGIYADGPLSGAGLSTTSDARMKTDITGISFEKARSVIAELRPVTFRWRADGTLSAGFVAQEVAPFLPDAVTEVGGTLRLKYDQIFTYGMAVLSGLLGKTESIERRVARLENEVRTLRNENNRLRAQIHA